VRGWPRAILVVEGCGHLHQGTFGQTYSEHPAGHRAIGRAALNVPVHRLTGGRQRANANHPTGFRITLPEPARIPRCECCSRCSTLASLSHSALVVVEKWGILPKVHLWQCSYSDSCITIPAAQDCPNSPQQLNAIW
jgi:hypothetical protein